MALPEIPEILAFLKSADPDDLERMGEAEAVEAFQSAAAEVPAYRDLLGKRDVDSARVDDIASFRARVPLVDKAALFPVYRIDQLCRHGSLRDVKGILPSSGHSGVFAFSVNTAKNVQNTAKMVDLALEYCLTISERPTLLVNTYPMGVNVHTSLPVANTGVNADIALAVIEEFGPHFDQLVLVGQPLFVKRLVEEGAERGIEWNARRVTTVTGGEGFTESWRTYVSRCVGIEDPDRPQGRFVASSMGVGELDLNLFHEIPETVHIIRAAYRDRALRHALFGEGVEVCPLFFIYYPMRTFIEEIPVPGASVGELAVSMVSPDIRNPLIRYKTGDLAKLVPYRTLEKVLAEHKAGPPPGLRLPFVAIFGRKEAVKVRGAAVPAETVKEALFREHEVAASVTGFFKVRDAAGKLVVEAQCRLTVTPARRLESLLGSAVEACLPRGVDFEARLLAFESFPYEISYERKYPYIGAR